jgi:spermidine/putrescine transport system ATP-binding protein
MADDLVVFDGVEKHFGAFTAVRSLDLSIQSGEFVALMGPSGCGKTTTLRMLAGLDTPSAGEIRLNGERINELPAHHRQTPMVWQSLALFPFLNVRENVEFGLKMQNVDPAMRKSRAMDWLDRMEIVQFADRHIDQLSGGQRQRVALARALVTEPSILLLDEPLSALDANLVIRMQGVLTRLQRSLGITFIYVTHSQSEAFAMADRVVIMNEGEIAQVGSSRDIYRNPANQFVAEFVGRNNIISGTVHAAAGDIGQHGETVPTGCIEISADAGVFQVSCGSGEPAKGSAATFVVGADLASVTTAEPADGNKLQATVISEEFVGAVVTLFLETADAVEFKVQLQQRELDKLAVEAGSSLWVSWDTSSAHLIEQR